MKNVFFEVHYVFLAQKMSAWEGTKMLNLATFWNFNPLPIGLFFELKKHNIPQKNTFFMWI